MHVPETVDYFFVICHFGFVPSRWCNALLAGRQLIMTKAVLDMSRATRPEVCSGVRNDYTQTPRDFPIQVPPRCKIKAGASPGIVNLAS